ncbi:MAG: hypothetical protein WC505_01985 [Patescibacteria group bacterium]
MHHLAELNPFRRRVFLLLAFTTIASVLMIGIVVYIIFTRQVMREAQDELAAIATKTAALIPAETHEKLLEPADQDSDSYRILELYLQSVMAGNAKIDDIYTLRPTDTAHLMTFVISGKETKDADNDGYIDETEQKAMLGEEYDTTDVPELEEGLTKPSVDPQITYDKWGSWLSGYAPLKDSSGKTVAVVGVDFAAATINSEEREMLTTIAQFVGAAILILLIATYLVARKISAPYKMLSHALYQIKHGNWEYTIQNPKGKEQELFADLFNAIREIHAPKTDLHANSTQHGIKNQMPKNPD